MNVLVVVTNYPFPGHEFSGLFNERSVLALREFCDTVEVLAPRPYVPRWPPVLNLTPRWRAYATIREYEVRNGVPVHRPAYIHLPRFGNAIWSGLGAFLCSRHAARNIHRRVGFHAIISFDLIAAGGLAWRLARDLRIPAACWAAGERIPARTVRHLDLVFYQSRELFEMAARVLRTSPHRLPHKQHVVLPRGIPEPPALPRAEIRSRVRAAWGIPDDAIVVLSVGRVTREKGIFELLEAVTLAAARDPRLFCVIVGCKPGFDETTMVQAALVNAPSLTARVRLVPACAPEQVWEYLCAADIFAFTSHKEGMPNALLEALVMRVPAVAFGIPPVLEIDSGSGGLITVRPFDVALFAEALVRLASSSSQRIRLAEIGHGQVMARFMVRKNMAEALRHLRGVHGRRTIAPGAAALTTLSERAAEDRS